jgi:phosphoglycerate dehydrogenase-like enzyme
VIDEREVRILSHVPLPLLARVSERFPKASLVTIPNEGELPDDVRGDVLLTMAWGSPNLRAILARGVRWVHAYGTGVNAFPFSELHGRPLTCSRGASAIPISEWVIAMMLCSEKRLPDAWIHEPPEVWNIFDLGGLYRRTLGLLGMGGIAQETAKRALAFGMTVLAHRRTAQPSPIDGVELVDFDALLARSDHLVIAAPATRDTRHLIGRDAIARMRRGVHLVNIARGDLVDQDALRAALDDGHVSLASLDTVSPEPLPAGHWLFTHPRVRLSPHCSWSGPGALDRLLDPFLANLARWLAGEPLAGLVDVELGY